MIHAEPGSNFSLVELEDGIKSHQPDVVFVIQGESSTGVLQPIKGLGKLCKK